MSRSLIMNVAGFALFLLLQILVFKRIVLFDTAFCFIYIAYLLVLPIETNPMILMLVGFFLGLLVDVFYNSAGLHASVAVLIGYLRNYWLAVITPQGGYDAGTGPTLAANGLQWFLVYSLPLLFLHHVVVFLIEAGGFHTFGYTSIKILSSTLFTLFLFFLYQLATGERRR
ncbi:MAG: Rod shape-determining protein MreD [Cyclobacteriaceae bacterium]|nr:Rod shape-determining protein MreD [Cyclobacteriaceae bacterium]